MVDPFAPGRDCGGPEGFNCHPYRRQTVNGTNREDCAKSKVPFVDVRRVQVHVPAAGVVLVVVSALAFGVSPILAKVAYSYGLSWPAVLAWRYVIGAAAAWFFHAVIRPRAETTWEPGGQRTPVYLALGAFYALNGATFFAALEQLPAATTTLIVYLYPGLVAVLTLRGGQGLKGTTGWVGLVLSLVGVGLVVGAAWGDLRPGGVGLALLSVFFYATYLVLADRLLSVGGVRERRPTVDPAAATAFILTATAGGSMILALALGPDHLLAPLDAWPSLVGLGLISTALAVGTLYAGMRRLGAAQAALISTVEPVWTVALAAWLLGEVLAPLQWVGGCAVIAGVLLSRVRVGRPPTADA